MPFDYHTVKHWPIAPCSEDYDRAACAAFAHAIGAGLAPAYAAIERPYIDGDKALPMMAVILGSAGALWTNEPGTGIDWTRMLHAEEAVTLHRPLPPQGRITAQFAVDEIYDKGAGKGALMYESARLTDAAGEHVATVKVTMFLRGNGGQGGATGEAPKPSPPPPERAPDAVIDLPTPRDDDAPYKLPAIFDAARNAGGGAAQSMLRGVCAFGLAGRALILGACGGDAARLTQLGLRYTGPVFTGETLRTEIWQLGEGRLAFRVKAVERDGVVMNNGYAQIQSS
ncbi:FAS1-like dehydratase domain-containing protein [Solimonas soli]|jgi:acyl dehydratase|uniref:FAS1-like dehydratase domain-containing protein n=1 Tax=Solimonas soli TaxID=413479 RepID=UPI000488D8B6|nr:MaoC family dehydratase N-terminal domain-containing protein [Solimonas soli]